MGFLVLPTLGRRFWHYILTPPLQGLAKPVFPAAPCLHHLGVAACLPCAYLHPYLPSFYLWSLCLADGGRFVAGRLAQTYVGLQAFLG